MNPDEAPVGSRVRIGVNGQTATKYATGQWHYDHEPYDVPTYDDLAKNATLIEASAQREHWTTGPGSQRPIIFDGKPAEALTGESDADWMERSRRESEEAREFNIGAYRAAAHGHIASLNDDLRRLERAVQRLGATDLYDVEVAETSAQVLIANACAQIDIALAALAHAIPKPEES